MPFSSFAHMICLIRSIALVMEGLSGPESLYRLCVDVDAAIEGWISLLPPSKKDIVLTDGSIDELMFQSHMLIHA